VRPWEQASLAFFAYIAVVALLRRGVPDRALRLVTAGLGAGVLLTLLSARLPHTVVLHDWLVPPILLLLAYWTSGVLFVAPMPRVEGILMGIDRRLAVDAAAARAPRTLAEALELAYVGVYPTIPIALVVHLLFTPAPDPQRFWTIILITDYICFAFLPWIQTRPPRAIDPAEPWISRVRRFNLQLLGAASIRVNTFPSGHAAEALAAALLVWGAPWPLVLLMFVNAVGISAGAVLGRYHYAADALTGWVVAWLVWWAC
jgi:hypothetical protein